MSHLRCVCIDGEIGSGKSTLCQRLAECDAVVQAVLGTGRRLVPVLECVEAWQDMGVFGLMCHKPKKWACAFQHVAMVSRISKWEQVWDQHAADSSTCLLLERAPHADRHIFTHVLTTRGAISHAESQQHGEWFDKMWEMRPQDIQRVGVLTCNFAEIKRRIFDERARTDEDAYKEAYLKQLHRRYNQVVETDEWPLRNVTIKLDATCNFKDCDRALYLTFARLCGVESNRSDEFVCVCGRCD